MLCVCVCVHVFYKLSVACRSCCRQARAAACPIWERCSSPLFFRGLWPCILLIFFIYIYVALTQEDHVTCSMIIQNKGERHAKKLCGVLGSRAGLCCMSLSYNFHSSGSAIAQPFSVGLPLTIVPGLSCALWKTEWLQEKTYSLNWSILQNGNIGQLAKSPN